MRILTKDEAKSLYIYIDLFNHQDDLTNGRCTSLIRERIPKLRTWCAVNDVKLTEIMDANSFTRVKLDVGVGNHNMRESVDKTLENVGLSLEET